MLVHLYDAGPMLKQDVGPTTTRLHVTVAYHVYTHAHNTLTVAQSCCHSYIKQAGV